MEGYFHPIEHLRALWKGNWKFEGHLGPFSKQLEGQLEGHLRAQRRGIFAQLFRLAGGALVGTQISAGRKTGTQRKVKPQTPTKTEPQEKSMHFNETNGNTDASRDILVGGYFCSASPERESWLRTRSPCLAFCQRSSGEGPS